ncbi:MAG: aminopeptidase [Flavobacteriales bacterium]|nr:aminopeptidase [Flavobacteriales bacterium]
MNFKIKFFTIPLFLVSSFVFGQSTNVEGSKYQFKKIAHHDATPVESQGKTSTCWSFSALSFFESELMRMGMKNVSPLSEMYIVRKAYELKAEKFIRMDGKINFGEGGAFHDIPLVIKNYGITPQSIYSGVTSLSTTTGVISDKRGEGYNHKKLYEELNNYMQNVLAPINNGTMESFNPNWKKGFNEILDRYLGKVNENFEVDKKTFTPKSYASSLGLNMDNYVSLTSFTNHPMNAKCLLEIPDNWAWGESYNVSLDDLFNATVEALKNGYTVAWGADVSEKGFSFKNGIAIAPKDESTIEVKGQDSKGFNDAGADRNSNAFLNPTDELVITPEVRQLGYDNKTTTDDHGMHIVGLFQDQKGKNYFLVKNSWGTNNLPKGYLYVSEAYFKYKTINVYLHKDGIMESVKSKLNLK